MKTEPSLPVQFWLEQPLEDVLIKDVKPNMPLELLLVLYLRIQKEKHPELSQPIALGPNGSQFKIERIVGFQSLEALVEKVSRPQSLDKSLKGLTDESLYTQPLPLDPTRNGFGCLADARVSQVGVMNQDPATELKTVLLSKRVDKVDDVDGAFLHGEQAVAARLKGELLVLPYAEFLGIWRVVHSMHLGLSIREQYEVASRIREGNPFGLGDTVRLRPIIKRPLFAEDVDVLTVVKHLDNGDDPREHDLLLIDRNGVLTPVHSYHYDHYEVGT